MSEQDKDKKTHKPTRRKLRELRKRGQVPRSAEIVSATITIIIFGYFWLSWEHQLERFKELVLVPASLYNFPFDIALKRAFDLLFEEFMLLVFPFACLVIFAGIMANVLQFGVLFAVEPLKPDVNKLNPVQGLKKIFSAKNVIETIKSLIKVLFLSTLFYLIVIDNLSDLVKLPYCNVLCLVDLMKHILSDLAIYAVPMFVFLAATDYFFQKFNFTKENMMSKEELKQEHKDTEGDPLSKGRRKSTHKTMATDDIAQRVQRASVVVTAARTAVAISYDKETAPLPVIVVVAKGVLAKRITDLARADKVFIVENIALAQGLAEVGKIDRFIPSEFLESTAKILRQAAVNANSKFL